MFSQLLKSISSIVIQDTLYNHLYIIPEILGETSHKIKLHQTINISIGQIPASIHPKKLTKNIITNTNADKSHIVSVDICHRDIKIFLKNNLSDFIIFFWWHFCKNIGLFIVKKCI